MLYPKLIPTHRDTFILVEDYEVSCDLRRFVIPKGFETNGADIHRVFWFIIHPFKPKYLHAVVAHDYICKEMGTYVADDVFEELLYKVDRGVVPRIMVGAMKLWHKVKLCKRRSDGQ
jgi:hypothetical protein